MGILIGLASAILWGAAGVFGGLAARRLGGFRTIAFGMLAGLAVALPLALATGTPGRTDPAALAAVAAVAAFGLVGLFLVYAAMRRGSISVVAPISATYGGVAALLAIATGEPTSPFAIGGLALAVLGAVLAARGDSSAPGATRGDLRVAALLAGGAAVLWGIQLWLGAQVQDEVGPVWIAAGMRIAGVIAISIPVLARAPRVVDRRALPLAMVAGVGEVFGFTLYLVASGYGVAQAAVLTGQYGTVAALIGVFVLKERLQRVQVIGVGLIVIAVVLLALPG
ncbi:MAG: EamA family transporter [Gaiellales bacterium]